MDDDTAKLTMEQEFQLTAIMQGVREKSQEQLVEAVEILIRQEMITRNLMKKLRV